MTQLLKIVPRDKAFYFFTSIGNYTGESAASLREFMERIDKVDLKSLEFHLSRGDFEKWTAEVLEDKKLAMDLRTLQKANVQGMDARRQLYLIVSRRYRELASKPST